MKIYLKAGRRDHRMYVAPGADDPSNSEWIEPDGAVRQIKVDFVAGAAEVPDSLGRWMLAQKMVQRHPSTLIIPDAHILMPEERVRRMRFYS